MGEFKNEVGNVYGYLSVIERAENTKNGSAQWLCKCKCGNLVKVSGMNLRKGNTSSCGCIHSKGNLFIKNFLVKENIHFKSEYSFNDCVSENGNVLKFDFCILDNNNKPLILIEYDGDIHYKYSNTGWNTKESFELRKARDKIKDEYCKQKNLKLIRISYLENLEQRLEEILNELQCQ